MIEGADNRSVLVIGGTGMLMPLCRSLPAKQLILAARFISHSDLIANLSGEVRCIPLDYTDKTSQSRFLEQLANWTSINLCVLWIHSDATDFSKRIIQIVSRFPNHPTIVHVFGSNTRPDDLARYAKKYKISFIPVQLGRVQTSNGTRWLTHEEISQQVATAIVGNYPDLDIC